MPITPTTIISTIGPRISANNSGVALLSPPKIKTIKMNMMKLKQPFLTRILGRRKPNSVAPINDLVQLPTTRHKVPIMARVAKE